MPVDPEIGTNLAERLNGPFSLRLFLQPTMALLFAIRDGRKDAAQDAMPYLSAWMGGKDERRQTLASAWASLSKVLVMAFVLDCAFQYATGGSIRIIEAVLMAAILCAIPYTLMRGPAARFAKRKSQN